MIAVPRSASTVRPMNMAPPPSEAWFELNCMLSTTSAPFVAMAPPCPIAAAF